MHACFGLASHISMRVSVRVLVISVLIGVKLIRLYSENDTNWLKGLCSKRSARERNVHLITDARKVLFTELNSPTTPFHMTCWCWAFFLQQHGSFFLLIAIASIASCSFLTIYHSSNSMHSILFPAIPTLKWVNGMVWFVGCWSESKQKLKTMAMTVNDNDEYTKKRRVVLHVCACVKSTETQIHTSTNVLSEPRNCSCYDCGIHY